MTSIRKFLIIVILSVVCLTNFIAALQGYRDSLDAVDRIEEQQLKEKAQTLGTLASQQQAIPQNLFGDDALFQVWWGEDLVAQAIDAPDTPFFESEPGFHLKGYAGHQWLLYRLELLEPELTLIVATRHRVYSSLTEEVLIRTILPIIWILPVIGILVWGIVNIGLKPLKELAKHLDSREANDFSRLKANNYAQELTPIVRALNGLFERLNDAFEREKRFSADAAHELRTPLSALKINLHNLSKTQNDNVSIESLKRTADRMEHSIEQLLSSHEVSIDSEARNFERINLYKAIQKIIVELYDQLSMKSQDIGLEGEDCFISGNPSSIAIMLRNLIDNASKYTPDHGSIKVTVGEQDNHAWLLIEDSGPGVDEEEYARVFDRFYRVGGDQNRSKVRGSGLGLSIVSDIAQTHDAQIVLSRSSQMGGLAIKISFPLAKA